MTQYDFAIIGGGIIGVSVAMHLAVQQRRKVLVLEAESSLAAHQTGHNSGVIHSGLYYKPGSLKARLCVQGRQRLIDFCRQHDIPFDLCGKLVVAVHPNEQPALDRLAQRGQANGLDGIQPLTPSQIRQHEPNITGIAGLWVPQTGIIDYRAVTRTYARELQSHGGQVRTNARVLSVHQDADELVLQTTTGPVHARHAINCAGLHSDRVARLCGADPGVQIVPFRGEYYQLRKDRRGLIRNLVYPVPDPRFPFLGVHFTRMIDGKVEAGPNAVLALARHGYTRTDFCLEDALEIARFGGFWRMARKYWPAGLGEVHRSFSKRAFTHALQRLLPQLQEDDLSPAGAGIRAQAMRPDGTLVDDFHIVQTPRMIHVLNAPSPAATASLAIGNYIADLARNF